MDLKEINEDLEELKSSPILLIIVWVLYRYVLKSLYASIFKGSISPQPSIKESIIFPKGRQSAKNTTDSEQF